MLTFLNSILPFILEVAPGDLSSGLAYVGAGIAVFTGFGTAIGQGIAASKAVEAVGRQPEAAGKIQTAMLIAAALVEGAALFAIVVALLQG